MAERALSGKMLRIMEINIPKNLLADLKILAAAQKLPLQDYILSRLRDLTIGMHVTKESLEILRKGLPSTKFF